MLTVEENTQIAKLDLPIAGINEYFVAYQTRIDPDACYGIDGANEAYSLEEDEDEFERRCDAEFAEWSGKIRTFIESQDLAAEVISIQEKQDDFFFVRVVCTDRVGIRFLEIPGVIWVKTAEELEPNGE